MKRSILILIVLAICTMATAMPKAWEDLQRDIGIQADAYRNSPEHLEMRSRDTRDYQVGDTRTFWRWNLSVMPPSWIQTPSTCRAVGEHCYIFVANSEWGTRMTQAHVDEVLARLEDSTINDPTRGAIEMDTALFGPIPDELDNDPRLIVFYSALGSFQGTSFDGYFSAYNQVTEAQAQQMNPSGHSNECEMIYMTCNPLSPVAPIRLSVLAHELQHLIHWGADANEETWLNEGCAELAMVAYGVPDPISGFPSNPDNNLTAWNQTTADYVKVMLFFTFLQEHFDDTGMILALVSSPANGIGSLETLLGTYYPTVTVQELFRSWTVANYLDEVTSFSELYNYTLLNLPNFTATSVNQYPSMTNQTIQAWATDYLSYTIPASPTGFTLQASTDIYANLLYYDVNNVCTSIDVVYGTDLSWIPLNTEAVKVVIVLSNSNTTAVSYSWTAMPVAGNDPVMSPLPLSLETSPNPFNGGSSTLEIRLKGLSDASRIGIYNLRGQLIRELCLPRGSLIASWDGRDSRGIQAPSGIYTLVLTDGKDRISKRITITK